MNYKYIESYSINPFYNLAKEKVLFNYVDDETSIIFLWQNEHTIFIGKNQNVYSEVNVKEFLNDGGKIARRLSGGGAVYHDLGNLCFSIISKRGANTIKYNDLIIGVLKRFGINATYNGRNDIMVNNKKISGNAFYENDEVCCQHGTLLVFINSNCLSKYLTPEQSKLARNGVKSISSRTINLTEIDSTVSIGKIKKEIIQYLFATKFDTKIDKKRISNLQKCFSSQKWIFEGEPK